MVAQRELETYWYFEDEWDTYEQLYDAFEWEIPETFNIASYVCDRWATDDERVAVYADDSEGDRSTLTFSELRTASNQMARYLVDAGIEPGDRIAVTGAQRPESLVAAVGAWKIGAVVTPVSALVGESGLAYRLADSGARLFLVDRTQIDFLAAIADDLDGLETVLRTGSGPDSLWTAIDGYDETFDPASTDPAQPAIVIYTSGTTGPPKGVVHCHQVLLGMLPGFVFKHLNLDVTDDDVIWSLAEWSWIGFIGFILPALFYGRPVVAYARSGSFDPETVFDLVERYGISFFSCTPTAVRMMAQVDAADSYDLSSTRVISVGAEKVGESVLEWMDEAFGSPALNVGFGQTECPLPTGECEALGVQQAGSMGVAVPGHEVAILDPDTHEPTVPRGEVGELAIRYEGDPMAFTEYLNKPEKTAETIQNGWLLTGDLSRQDEDGYFFFESRKDDVIISSGYRMGPGEIEESVASHPAVVDAGVIGVPHETRGEIPKAFVKLAEGYEPDAALKESLQSHVKADLAKYEYPREIEFVADLPTTTTGKMRRAALRDREGVDS